MLNVERVNGAYQMRSVDEQCTRQVEAFLETNRNTVIPIASLPGEI